MIADDRRPYCDLRSAIRDHMETSLYVLSSAIVCDRDRRIADDRRSMFPYDRRRSQTILRSAICDPRSYGNQPLPVRLLRIIAPEKFDDEGNPKPEALEKNEAVLSAYRGSIIKQLGTINIPCKYIEKKINCIFYVKDTPGPAILGLKACTALKLISLHSSLKTNQLDQAAPTNSFEAPAQNSGTRKKSPNYIESQVPLEE